VAVVVPSQAVLDTLGSDGPRNQERVVMADPHPPTPEPAARAHDRPLHLVMVGRLAAWKGQDVFLQAFAHAFPDGGARASVVGAALFGDEEHYAAELQQLVAELGLEGRVELLGQRADVAVLLGEADIVVHASRIPEPFGQAVVEGMLAGAAVVATEGGGPSELIRPDVDGVLVPPDDVAALAAALQRLAADPALRARLGTSARHRALVLTDPTAAGAAIEGVHERAAARRRRTRPAEPVSP